MPQDYPFAIILNLIKVAITGQANQMLNQNLQRRDSSDKLYFAFGCRHDAIPLTISLLVPPLLASLHDEKAGVEACKRPMLVG